MHIGIIGAGNVGIGIADALVYLKIGKKITIFNRHIEKALGEVWDLNDNLPLLQSSALLNATDNYEDLKKCEVIVICAGVKQKPGETRLDLLQKNSEIIKNIIKNMDRVNKDAKIIMVTNPVDILTRLAIRVSKRASNLIFGSGTVLDSIRLRESIAEKIKVDRKNIHAYVLGEHGDSEFVLWSACKIGPLELEKFDIENLEYFKASTAERVKRRAYEIIEKKGFTKQAIGICVATLIDSILKDKKSIFTVSVPVGKTCECIKKDVCLSLPCVVGKNGIERRFDISCSEDEFEKLKNSAKKLDEAFRSLKI